MAIRIDYSNYLDQQNQWAGSLVRLARTVEPIRARELGEVVATTLRRMLSLAAYRHY